MESEVGGMSTTPGRTGTRRMNRAARRDQIVQAATAPFAKKGFAATSLDEVAAAVGVSRAILYRHFESKTELYRAVLDRVGNTLLESVKEPPGAYTGQALHGLINGAQRDPDGFRLLFRHAVGEPEFQSEMKQFHEAMVEQARWQISAAIADERWSEWAARLAPKVAIDAVLTWLDIGMPDPDRAGRIVQRAVGAITEAAQPGACD